MRTDIIYDEIDEFTINQSSNLRDRSSWSQYCGRTYRRKINGFWMNITCGCCYAPNANVRHLQQKLSKGITLRSHRNGKKRMFDVEMHPHYFNC